MEIIKGYEDSRIKFIKLDKNSQGTKPRNIGIQESQGQYIALLDSDDEWLPTKLERQLKFLQQFNDEKMVCFTDLKLKEAKIRYSNNNEFVDGTNILEYILIDKNGFKLVLICFRVSWGKKLYLILL